MRYERVKVTRDTNTVHSREVPPWEIPMLEYLFGDEGNVVRTGEFVTPTPGKLINLDYPEAKTELKRLIDAYKGDPKSGIPYAISVYGNGRQGERALQKLIDDAREADEEAVALDEAVALVPRVKRKQRMVDSLLN
jgi:hypothetical protein